MSLSDEDLSLLDQKFTSNSSINRVHKLGTRHECIVSGGRLFQKVEYYGRLSFLGGTV